MASQPPGMLTRDDLNDTDGRVLDVLHEGRATPQYVADQLDVSRTYASERLKRLVEHGHVDKLASGLYELADDPREDTGSTEDDVHDQLQSARRAREDALERAEKLRRRVDQLEQEESQSVDVDGLRRALDDAEAAAERGDGDALRDALGRARETLDE